MIQAGLLTAQAGDKDKNIVCVYVNSASETGNTEQGALPQSNQVFRCTLYEPSYKGFKGRDLTPGKPIEPNPVPSECLNLK